MAGTVYDEHVRFYLEFVDKYLSEEPSLFRIMLDRMVACLGEALANASAIDIACGEGYVARHLAARGARDVIGIDISSELVEEARRRTDRPNVTFRLENAHTLASVADDSLDVAVSQMAMMDIPDHVAAFASVARVLRPGGRFVFSMLHPCFEARPFHVVDNPPYLRDADDREIAVLVSRYREEGHFTTGGSGVRGHVGSYHRMLSTYVNDLVAAGFRIDRIEEPIAPVDGLWGSVPKVMIVAATLDR